MGAMKNQYSVHNMEFLKGSKAMGGERFYVQTNYRGVTLEWFLPYEIKSESEAYDYAIEMHRSFNKQKVK